MVYKVDGGGSVAPRTVEPAVKKPEVKPAFVNNDTPQTNAAVYANRSATNNQADLLRTKLNAPYTATALRQTPTITPVGSSRVDLQACKLEYSIVSPK